MNATMALLDRALHGRKTIDLAADIGVHYTAVVNSKKMGHLSPLLAGQIAVFLNENVEQWMAVAALEAAREGKAKKMLEEHLKRTVKSSLNTGQILLQQWTQYWPKRPFFTPRWLKFVYSQIDCGVGSVVKTLQISLAFASFPTRINCLILLMSEFAGPSNNRATP